MRGLRKDGQPRRVNRWHAYLMDQYTCAAQAWWVAAERVTFEYATELHDYKRSHPHPQLRDFMIGLSPVYRSGLAA